jgi:hypothetical protein
MKASYRKKGIHASRVVSPTEEVIQLAPGFLRGVAGPALPSSAFAVLEVLTEVHLLWLVSE